MKKGKFGIVLCFYPIAAFAAAILQAPLIAAIIAAAAIFIERDEWTGRQSLQAWMLSLIITFFFNIKNLCNYFPIPFFTTILNLVTTILYVFVCLAGILLSILGITRVMKDSEANIPLLADIAYRVYGKRRPHPAPTNVPPTNYPYGYPQQPPMATPMQNTPYPPQSPQTPYSPPQYAPPVNVPPQQESDAPNPNQP